MENNQPIDQSPENNTETIFSGDEFSTQGYDKHIRQARNAIFLTAGLLALNLAVLAANAPGYYEYLWIDIAIWGAFIAGFIVLGLWTKKKPYSAIIGTLILYALFIILNAVVDITTIYKGLIFKVVIIIFLVKGLNDAKAAQQMKGQIEKQ